MELVERPPEVAVADGRRGAKGEHDDRGEQNAHPRVVVELGRHQHEHVAHHRHRDDEDDLLPERKVAGAEHHHDNAEYDAAAENPPVDRPPFHGFGAAQEHAGDRNRWDNQADHENVLARHETGEPAGEAGDSEDASRHREPTQHLHHAELDAHTVVRALIARGIGARDHLRGHRIRDRVLKDGADHHQHCAKHIQLVGASKGEPTAGSTGKDQQARGHQQRADEDVGFSL